jgi:tetratricopeptide (TPR) repeat protein
MKKSRAVFLLPLLVVLSCISRLQVAKPAPKPAYFSDLAYTPARERYRRVVEEKFKQRDLSYILSLLSYGITCFYDLKLEDARKAFWAAYKIDEGDRPEAAKLYDWLVVDSRTVYKLKKRERELVHFYLALCYLLQDNPEEALVEFKKLRQIDQDASKLPIVNFYLGLVYEKLGKPDDALIEYRALSAMADTGSHLFHIAQQLIAHIDTIGDGSTRPDSGWAELIIQVEHQTEKSIGRTEVYLDASGICLTLPAIMDSFPVRLSALEANRKAAQEAAAKAARLGLRLLGGFLLDRALPGKGEKLADEVADITLGKEEENRDIRAWGYAPLNFSFARLKIPVATTKVRLVFYDRAGALLGFCDYPITGGNRRVGFTSYHKGDTSTFLLIAGLAEEFFVY